MPKLFRPCDFPGCTEEGTYPAPKARVMPESFLMQHHPNVHYLKEVDEPNERLYFCLEHIRDFNLKWDFFSGMTQREIEAFYEDAMTGHRAAHAKETGARRRKEKLHEQAEHWRSGADGAAKKRRVRKTANLSEKEKAMALLQLEYPLTKMVIKKHYRKLVKKHHPDLRTKKHSPEDDAMFHKLHQAYLLLLKQV